ncbi:hydantoinase B/oxoprolinase family protein [soil metagenome]
MQSPNPKPTPWKLYIDTGGTFTDCMAVDPDGGEHRCKVLSSSSLRGLVVGGEYSKDVKIKLDQNLPDGFFNGFELLLLDKPETIFYITGFDSDSSTLSLDREIDLRGKGNLPAELRSPEEAPILGARMITKTPINQEFPPMHMRLSTTKGTNALLERGGAKTLFLITEGFRDLLHIKNQQRPDLFALDIRKAKPFYHHIVEVPERVDAGGNVIKPLNKVVLKRRLEPCLDEIEAAGICLMNSYKNSDHENQVEEILRELGVEFISKSAVLSPEIKIVPRAVTTDVNAYLTPVMERYLNRISEVIQGHSLRVMSSGGNLVEADHYRPKDGLLSGPAGGVIGAAAIGKRTGYEKIISFDMGGTSTDVARYDGATDYVYEHSVGDATLTAPAVEIETVAAGGGSICGFDGQSLTVGPESAGADPGPACYGRGGPLTITDVNLLSGRLHPENFHISIIPEAAELRLEEIRDATEGISRGQILEGFIDIANERMAQAIRKISIQKGFDPSEYAMVAFGGAGAQHALAIAQKLNLEKVLVPSDAGLLSAYGLRQARLEQIATRQVLKSLADVQSDLPGWFDELIAEARSGLLDQGMQEEQIENNNQNLFLRIKGQDTSLEIEFKKHGNVEKRFKKAYETQYGHWLEDREIEVEAIRVKVSENSSGEGGYSSDEINDESNSEIFEIPLDHSPPRNNRDRQGEIYSRESLKPGTKLTGPALILDPHSTTVIEKGWEGVLLEDGTWLMEREKNLQGFSAENIDDKKLEESRSEAINLQLYTNRFRSVADQMGEMLRKTAMSVNIKERLDFSCALLDASGYLVVNAPHIPVHLGAMGTCVRTLIDYLKKEDIEFEEGDIIVTNHPGLGGSHLPDVTVVTPVFFEDQRIGFAASRAHHAEIGGKRPGSMPPDAENLAEEGVVIPPTFIARGGKFNWETIRKLLRDNRWPSRSPEENMADLQAAVAANHRGAEELKKIAWKYGASEVTTYMKKLKKYASGRMRTTLNNVTDGEYRAVEEMDDGSGLVVSCKVNGDSVSIDFTGTSGVHPGNLNANPSIVNSVVMYVLRLMVDEPLPLNDGLLEPVKLTIPGGMLNPEFPGDPTECPAVVGGNIETSQRLVDTLLKAFELSACSYGTMNNVLFGNKTFGYYETVAGGTGAGDGFHGADAVHQHMTNTRATDPEILEHRYPVRLDRYAIREGSGGRGKWNGGNGLIRELTFLEPVSLSVLAQHRVVPPYGIHGGEQGKTGKHWIKRQDGSIQELKWRDGADLQAGDGFLLHTPGGGGWGKAY